MAAAISELARGSTTGGGFYQYYKIVSNSTFLYTEVPFIFKYRIYYRWLLHVKYSVLTIV